MQFEDALVWMVVWEKWVRVGEDVWIVSVV